MAFGYEERRCWANCTCSWFPRFPTYVILIHQRHRQTDRWKDDRQSQGHTLHYSASHVKIKYRQVRNFIRTFEKFMTWP